MKLVTKNIYSVATGYQVDLRRDNKRYRRIFSTVPAAIAYRDKILLRLGVEEESPALSEPLLVGTATWFLPRKASTESVSCEVRKYQGVPEDNDHVYYRVWQIEDEPGDSFTPLTRCDIDEVSAIQWMRRNKATFTVDQLQEIGVITAAFEFSSLPKKRKPHPLPKKKPAPP